MRDPLETLRIFEPYPGIYAYYDGRIPGRRLHSEGPNWLDDGAYSLGIASYAIVRGQEALIYDTHITLAHARAIRAHVESLGATRLTVVLSHFHKDHVAGNAVFSDCTIISNQLTHDLLVDEQGAMAEADPPIAPLVLPNRFFVGSERIAIGGLSVELHQFDIHSQDGTVLWLPNERLLFAGDTLEDSVTYMTDPERLGMHMDELERMAAWPIRRILPCHGDPERIRSGGYDVSFISATRAYVDAMRPKTGEPMSWSQPLMDVIADSLAGGDLVYEPAYEAVHQANIELLRDHRNTRDG